MTKTNAPIKIIVIFSFFFVAESYALRPLPVTLPKEKVSQSDCTNKDIVRDIFKNPDRSTESKRTLSKLFSTPRNQGNVGWCYAFTAADMLSIEIGTPVSPMHMAALYNKQEYNDPSIISFLNRKATGLMREDEGELYEGGHIHDALEYSIENGRICTEAQMPFERPSRLKSGRLSPINSGMMITWLNDIRDDIENKVMSFEEACSKLEGMFINPVMNLSSFINETITAETAAHILLSQNLNNSFEEFIEETCGDSQAPIESSLSVHSHWNITISGRRTFLQKLNDLLNRGKPIGLEYREGHVLEHGNFNLAANHASVLLARRWNNEKQVCEFKIRDSKGRNSCDIYKEGIDCNDREGTFWISDEELVQMTQKFTWIDYAT